MSDCGLSIIAVYTSALSVCPSSVLICSSSVERFVSVGGAVGCCCCGVPTSTVFLSPERILSPEFVVMFSLQAVSTNRDIAAITRTAIRTHIPFPLLRHVSSSIKNNLLLVCDVSCIHTA
jgi:hypothetical protein